MAGCRERQTNRKSKNDRQEERNDEKRKKELTDRL